MLQSMVDALVHISEKSMTYWLIHWRTHWQTVRRWNCYRIWKSNTLVNILSSNPWVVGLSLDCGLWGTDQSEEGEGKTWRWIQQTTSDQPTESLLLSSELSENRLRNKVRHTETFWQHLTNHHNLCFSHQSWANSLLKTEVRHTQTFWNKQYCSNNSNDGPFLATCFQFEYETLAVDADGTVFMVL